MFCCYRHLSQLSVKMAFHVWSWSNIFTQHFAFRTGAIIAPPLPTRFSARAGKNNQSEIIKGIWLTSALILYISLQAITRFSIYFYQPTPGFSFQEGLSRRLIQNANNALSHSANQMRVILALEKSGVSNFALVKKKTNNKMPSISTNQQSVILPPML